MISVEKAKSILQDDTMSDQEVEKIIAELQNLTELVYDKWISEKIH